MSLKEYHKKRSFKKTPEPKGKKGAKGRRLRFVIQKHEATRLHYDLRLEMDGVMKSWAVPKGPSLDPTVKRLAMHVEDHPIDYNTFEGTIPEGNYGAGTVMIWDNGTYRSYETDDPKKEMQMLRDGYERGDLKFILEGEKVQGAYALVKTKFAGENSWLLIKKKDSFASAEDIALRDRSVVTGRSMKEIEEGKSERKTKKTRKTKSAKKMKVTMDPFPKDIKPMLATLVEASFDRKGWIFEQKWDGYRAVAHVKGKKATLTSRTQKSFSYPEITDALSGLGHDAVLDGEIVVLDTKGHPDFQLLQQWHHDKRGTIAYMIFDLLYLDGHDTTQIPLLDRKKLLKKLLPKRSKLLRFSDHIEVKGKTFFAKTKKKGFEGIIAKDGASTYQEGIRGNDWLKIKSHLRQEVVIGGFTEPRKTRKELGALIVGVYEDGKLLYTGHTGGGFTQSSLKDVRKKLEPLIRKTCPFAKTPETNEPATWVEPKLVCEVKFQEWTHGSHMRQPIFQGLRPDKNPKDVHREAALSKEEEKKLLADKNVKQPKLLKKDPEKTSKHGTLELTHLEKVFFPESGITKGDLLEYYTSVSKYILPYLKDRPESLNRHPNGITGESFYHKDVGEMPPDFVETIEVPSESHGKPINYLMCQDKASLLYMVNLGCIEINPWNSRKQSLYRPDYMIMDLDPEDISFDHVIEAAQATHEVLKSMKIPSVCKTSGKTGLHIYVPLGATYDYEQCKRFCELIGQLVHRKLPNTTSLTRRPKDRQKKVYLDFLQNNRGQTLAAPYSVRPAPGAPVSTPLEWKEVKKGLDPKDFTIKTTLKRIKKKGDLWKPVLGRGIDMEKALKRLK